MVGLQLFRIDLHLELLEAITPYDHIRHARYFHQVPPERPIGDHRQIRLGIGVRGKPDLHDPARRRQGREHPGYACPGWQCTCCHCKALLHQLPGKHDVSPGFEDEDDRRDPGNRLGAHSVELRGAVKRGLQLGGDQGFHLGGGHSGGFSLNLHKWRRELGKDIHWHGAKLLDAKEHHHCTNSNHQEAKVYARSDDPTHHF